MTTTERTIIRHVAEAWSLLLTLPAEDRDHCTEILAGCYAWEEVDADATGLWRASLVDGHMC
ncbi:MAG: hypothetical protein ABI662_09505 [Dermatophilaceae bacterium]